MQFRIDNKQLVMSNRFSDDLWWSELDLFTVFLIHEIKCHRTRARCLLTSFSTYFDVNKSTFGIMGKLNVAVLRYLTKEDFRVLTAVSKFEHIFYLTCIVFTYSHCFYTHNRLKWA